LKAAWQHVLAPNDGLSRKLLSLFENASRVDLLPVAYIPKMQADSSRAPAEFSQQLYEQLRFDDVWNKRRLAWYIKASQTLVNRSVIEKLWLLAHATQILGILWINMCVP
jgi:hypothetical protein